MNGNINIIVDKCVGCKLCKDKCIFGAIRMSNISDRNKNGFNFPILDLNKCTCCGLCVRSCKFNAIEQEKNESQVEIDKNSYNGIMVYAEQKHGEISDVVYELLNEGKRLSKKLGTFLSVALIGSNIRQKSYELINSGADVVYVCNDQIFYEFQDDPYTDMLVRIIKKEKPEIVLIGATDIGRSFASRVAVRLKTGLTADCVSLEIDNITRNLHQTRPAFSGNIMATILTPKHRPQIVTVRNKIFKKANIEINKKGRIIDYKIDAKTLLNRTEFLGSTVKANVVNLSSADVVVSGGRGLGKQKGIELIKELADSLGGVIAVSRAVVDSGWISEEYQIGQTGKIISPKIYIACGISGQIQHMIGIDSSSIIIAINKDETCPIMQIASYALEGDLYEIIPNMINEIKLFKSS
ncbi:MAG: electron transfer flavoprotein subunit alpha [Endomicrobium sp.]|jgi:electron transfer flavoprotein alpha subunit|nr:electron transfer flavoprotein subunit alpha [Endomicrobium sp.]